MFFFYKIVCIIYLTLVRLGKLELKVLPGLVVSSVVNEQTWDCEIHHYFRFALSTGVEW